MPIMLSSHCKALLYGGAPDYREKNFTSTGSARAPHILQWEKRTMNNIKIFLADETGLELSEYAVAAALVALVVAAAFTDLGTAIAEKLVDLKGKVKP
mgnify:CR=1 FL=1